MKEGEMFLNPKTFEACRCLFINADRVYLTLFETDFIMAGPMKNFQKFGMMPIDEAEYKIRVLAMRMFQNEKKNGSKYDDYLNFYNDLRGSGQDFINSGFNIYGGYSEFKRSEIIDSESRPRGV